MTPSPWHPFHYDLKFHVGEFTAARIPLRVQRRVYALDDIRHYTDAPVLPPLAADQQGYLLANIPTPEESAGIAARHHAGWHP